VLDWLAWPADLLLSASGWIASWFLSGDATRFVVVQMMFAPLTLAASWQLHDHVVSAIESPNCRLNLRIA
jgi:hypothetical protein